MYRDRRLLSIFGRSGPVCAVRRLVVSRGGFWEPDGSDGKCEDVLLALV